MIVYLSISIMHCIHMDYFTYYDVNTLIPSNTLKNISSVCECFYSEVATFTSTKDKTLGTCSILRPIIGGNSMCPVCTPTSAVDFMLLSRWAEVRKVNTVYFWGH
jgi:hypothetical protein